MAIRSIVYIVDVCNVLLLFDYVLLLTRFCSIKREMMDIYIYIYIYVVNINYVYYLLQIKFN